MTVTTTVVTVTSRVGTVPTTVGPVPAVGDSFTKLKAYYRNEIPLGQQLRVLNYFNLEKTLVNIYTKIEEKKS